MTASSLDSSGLHGLEAFEERIRGALAEVLGVPAEDLALDRPRQAGHGEFALPCFQAAQAAGRKPPELAAELAARLQVPEVEARAVGPFLNFRVEGAALARRVLQDALRPDFGRRRRTRTSIVEFGSPNIAKPMHVGHLRSTVIGAALARILEHLGHRVVRINHLGDWGAQFGKLVAAWRRWGQEDRLEADPIGHLLALYVRFHEEAEENPGLEEQGRQAFQELESGEDNEARRLWQRFTELSLREFQKTFDRLGARFDHVRGESWYEDRLPGVLAWLEGKDLLQQSEGAWIVDLEPEGIQTPCLVKTAHGTTLYATRDLAAALSRWEEFAFDECLYVVGNEQKLHFEQLRAVLRRAGCDWADRIEHVAFGLVRFAEGKLSTRKGRVLLLKEVLDRASELALEIVREKNPGHPDPEGVAEQVGVGAVIFHDLKHQRTKDVVFDWKEVLSFDGDTGPYLQYTHARCCAILRKAGRPVPDFAALRPEILAEDRELLTALGRFPAAVREAGDRREPSILAGHLLRLANAGNAFYRDRRVLGEEPPVEDARLAAIGALRNTLGLGLGLLGVPAPESM